MKKILIILLSLFVISSANAEFLSTLGALDSAVYYQMNVPIDGNKSIDSFVVRFMINRAMQQLCFDAPALEKMDTITGGTEASTRDYDLPDDFTALNSVVKFYGDTLTLPLNYTVVGTVWEQAGGLTGTQPNYKDISYPRYAWNFNKKLYLQPHSVTNDSYLISYFAICSTLTVPGSKVEILEGYRDAIVDYACYLLSMRGAVFTQADAYYTSYLRKSGKTQ